MGVYIKGVKKPKDCNACFLDLYDRQTYCRNGEKALCPLIEVKTPHGRLIDADALDGILGISEEDIYVKATLEEDAPTVIGAEVE